MHKDWWKWGLSSELKHIDDYPKLKNYIEERWKTKLKEGFFPPKTLNISDISEKTQESILNTFASLSTKKINFKKDIRLQHALGKSYYDVIRICSGDNIVVPDAIIFPNHHEDVEYILKQASENNIKITPFGGGTNVVGSLNNDNLIKKNELKCTVNMQHMNKLLHIDKQNHLATFQGGILGPQLEKLLNEAGYTLGHFPQSFEYSTLGGWVVTRSAGQESTYYGKIEDIVENIKVATPIGTIYTAKNTHDASGINILSLFIGSEGTLGIVTEVTVKIKPLPRNKRWIIALFPNFELGTNAFKTIIQKGLKPSVIRLSDTTETMIFSKMSSSEPKNIFETLKKDFQKSILKLKNLETPCLMMMRFEEHDVNTVSSIVATKSIIESHSGFFVGKEIGHNWEESRFKLPYLRDTLVEHHIFIDTYETLVPWQNISKLHKELNEQLSKCSEFGKKKGLLMAHLSHVYPSGACIYFTAITTMEKGNEKEQWQTIKALVTNTIMANNGTLSHHHGVGADHQKWYLKNTDPITLEILRTIKKQLDPKSILNSGKLFHIETK